jgi:hypothetical protein
MTAPASRAFIIARIRELGIAYEALEDQAGRSGGQVPGRRGRGEPPIPIRTGVVDLMDDIESSVLRLHTRALTLLGWHLPPVRLARKGQWLPCPHCERNSLLIDRQDWAIFCATTTCKARWSWGAEINLLGQILTARGLEGEQVPARALEVAQEVADDTDADAGMAGVQEARSA